VVPGQMKMPATAQQKRVNNSLKYSDNTNTKCGTGYRHKVLEWPTSLFTGRFHKLVIPPKVPSKKFILVVGASHLRALVDGFIRMPQSQFVFGFMSTSGASASEIHTEIWHAAVPRRPDAVCVMSPSNNLTNTTVQVAGVDFTNLLATCLNRWSKIVFSCLVAVDLGNFLHSYACLTIGLMRLWQTSFSHQRNRSARWRIIFTVWSFRLKEAHTSTCWSGSKRPRSKARIWMKLSASTSTVTSPARCLTPRRTQNFTKLCRKFRSTARATLFRARRVT
uniref:Uncharacterized protein n=1 Tax=Acanthochromis polyacanthus TaxID=80966 RepID=A0A3Q1FNF8_9TELE